MGESSKVEVAFSSLPADFLDQTVNPRVAVTCGFETEFRDQLLVRSREQALYEGSGKLCG